MRGLVAQVRACDPVVRLLCVNQLGINLGFYLLMPYLAAYLTGGLGLAAGTAGLLLGVRNLSQQGMFLAGGALADRFGHKPMIVAGCLLRTVGFVLLALGGAVPLLLAGMACTGFAGALFNPAVRAYLAERAGERRVEAFAVFNVFYQAGILAGPLVGLALMTVDFTATCLVAAGIFGLLSVAQIRALPGTARPADADGRAVAVRQSWREVLADRTFLSFSAAMAGSYVLGFQVYLALPLLVTRELGEGTAATVATTAVFAVSAAVTILGQVRVTAWSRRRWGPARSMERGLLVAGAAFAVPALALVAVPLPGSATAAAAAVAAAGVLALGTMIVYPFEMDTIVALSGGRRVATRYGLYNTVVGIAVTVGNLGVGAGFDAVRAGLPAYVPWPAMAVLGAVCALALRLLRSRVAASRTAAELATAA